MPTFNVCFEFSSLGFYESWQEWFSDLSCGRGEHAAHFLVRICGFQLAIRIYDDRGAEIMRS